jgi:hypothetical protein
MGQDLPPALQKKGGSALAFRYDQEPVQAFISGTGFIQRHPVISAGDARSGSRYGSS